MCGFIQKSCLQITKRGQKYLPFKDVEQSSQTYSGNNQGSRSRILFWILTKNPTMQTLANILRGWPDTIEKVPISARSYWEFRDEMTL